MPLARDLNIKPSCLAELHSLPAAMTDQFWEKVNYLVQDPLPDGRLKKKIRSASDVFRLRIGDYRLFYTFGSTWIRLLAFRVRRDAYRTPLHADAPASTTWGTDPENLEDEELAAGASPLPVLSLETPSPRLPQPITPEWLVSIGVPEEHHAALTRCKTEDDVLTATAPWRFVSRVIDTLYPRAVEEILQQPDLAVFDTRDLIRYREGDLFSFLLRLDPDQERLVDWALRGPALIKGGPGTGKSLIALYRVRSLLDHAERVGSGAIKLLFATYTPALARFSEQLLQQLLGERMSQVTVRAADDLAIEIVKASTPVGSIASPGALLGILKRELAALPVPTRERLSRLRPEYLLDEIEWVIEGRERSDLNLYLAADRAGRGIALSDTARRAVWELYSRYRSTLEATATWSRSRIRQHAYQQIHSGACTTRYDAVLIDEAQDLTPVALSLLTELSASQRGLYLTADASQSIYFRGFSWSSVHERLQFRGRTVNLRRNYRSTREIAAAASSFLQAADIGDPQDPVGISVQSGPLPVLATYTSHREQWQQIVAFIRQASRNHRLRPSAAAILVPTPELAEEAAQAVSALGLSARHMPGHRLDLEADVVKVLTIQAAKGLEFPFVVIASLHAGNFPFLPTDVAPTEVEEEQLNASRILYVGLTRAMRALMLTTPADQAAAAIRLLDPSLWQQEPGG